MILRQDFREAARFVFFASDDPEFPYWTPGGTSFVVNYHSRPYVITCAHVLDKTHRGDEPVITNTRHGNKPVRARRVHRVHDLDGRPLDADMADVAIVAFDDEVSVAEFSDTAYVISETTFGTSERGDKLLVHGALKDPSFITPTEIAPHFATFEFEDVGATSDDPFIREALAKFEDSTLQNLTGLSGSPVFNTSRNRLCGMVVRGGINESGEARIRYVDIFDIAKLLESIRSDEAHVTYDKNVKRLRAR
ncbi:MAG: serine protease [Alphaproteobacteria bacterium]|nr:serine protease [Alphaproteobacteria bacterium]